MPTETVYGLAAAARDESAVARIFSVKGRPSNHPLIVHIGDPCALERWGREVPDSARELAAAFWPGPLTMLVWRHPSVLDAVTGGRDTVGLRMPDHPVALEILSLFDDGVAAPSANRFGAVSPTRAEHVVADIGAWLDWSRDVVIDGGACAVGIESTIVDLTTDRPTILRPGAVTAESIEAVVGPVQRTDKGPSRAPGMLAAHYAPACEVIVATDAADAESLLFERRSAGQQAEVWSVDDLDAFAHDLYARLRNADERGLDTLIVIVPPSEGIGVAIIDRLLRAATGSAR